MNIFKLSLTLFINCLFYLKGNSQISNQVIHQKSFKDAMILAVDDENTTDSLYNLLSKIPLKNAMVIGNLGTLDALKSKHAFNPFTKLKYVKKGISKLNTAIQMENSNLELRFMRFAVEYYTPSFLGLSIHKTEDKNKIIQLIQQSRPSENSEMVKAITNFLIDNQIASHKEELILKPYLK